MITAFALAAVAGLQSGFPVGSYKPDISKAPAEGQGVLKTYFGRAFLVVGPDGQFELCGTMQEGYWRKSGDKFVFVYDGFLRI